MNKNKSSTPAERQRKRRQKLNAIAQAHGFDSWGKLETAALQDKVIIIKPPSD